MVCYNNTPINYYKETKHAEDENHISKCNFYPQFKYQHYVFYGDCETGLNRCRCSAVASSSERLILLRGGIGGAKRGA